MVKLVPAEKGFCTVVSNTLLRSSIISLGQSIIYHNEIQHFYPYYFEDGLDGIWDAACTVAWKDAATCNNQFAFFEISRCLMAHVKDSRIFMNFTCCQNGVCYQIPNRWPDVEFSFIGDSLYVKNIGNSLIDKLEKWDRVLTVNNMPFEQWLDSKLAITPASTRGSALKKLSSDIFKSVGYTPALRLTLQNISGEMKTVELAINQFLPYKVEEYPYLAKEINSGIWHVNLCFSEGQKMATYKDFTKYIPKLKNAKGIIFIARKVVQKQISLT